MIETETITRNCPFCGFESSVDVPSVGLKNYRAGMMVQEAFPELSVQDREIIITGIHDKCYEAAFLIDDM